MLAENKKSLWMAIGLLAVIVLTRTQHFGSAVYLPDATLAVLFLGGLLVARSGWLGLALLVAFGMDAYALAFKVARRILAEGKFERFVAERYASYDSGFGREIATGRTGFRQLEKLVLTKLGEPTPRSGKQEYLENLLGSYLHG